MKRLFTACLLLGTIQAGLSQTNFKYRPSAHSHNDYEQSKPLENAYALGFGSIEADVYVQNGELMVAHERSEIKPERTFRQLYLTPLLKLVRQHEGYPYPGHHPLQLMVDLKDAEALPLLEHLLKSHQFELKQVRFVVSGSMPRPEEFKNYDEIINFDGRRSQTYAADVKARVPLISADFKEFITQAWDGTTPLSTEVEAKLKAFVTQAHANGQKTRVWGTPNTALAYQTLQKIGLDYIGSDQLDKLAATLN